jgi:hypothetical protein
MEFCQKMLAHPEEFEHKTLKGKERFGANRRIAIQMF